MQDKINGIYLLDNRVIGTVEDFNPKEWFGKVSLLGMEDMAEYGTLEPNCTVRGPDGTTYSCPE